MVNMAELPKYEAYKESCLNWIDTIPYDWELKRFKYILDEINLRSKTGKETLLSLSKYNGVLPKDSLEERSGCAETLVGYKRVGIKDLVINKMQAVNGLLAVSRIEGITSPDYSVYRSKNNLILNIDFLGYLLLQPEYIGEFKKRVTGVMEGFIRLYTEDLYSIHAILPDVKTQFIIVKYLDKKSAQIDEAIKIKQQQITLLKERKQIIIQKAVTQGLDPNVQMKDSGVDWIGKIPVHWEIRRSKFLFTQRKEKALNDDVQLSATQAYGVIPQEKYEALTGKRVVKIQFHLDKRKHVEKDDFVISMRSFQGGLERAWSCGCIRSSYVVLKALQNIDPLFYGYLLKLPSYIAALQQTASFIRDGQDLNFDNFSRVDLFIPPLEEQTAIANYVESFLTSSDEAMNLIEQQIEKLKEYKTTLINSAVTGKIKITPEMVE
ncbi:restriction endonuclease subunit S [Erwinia tasmaniensis]|uniref:Type I restriction-modification system, specifity subunit n=1 Tax=Erwinia tasmaniensis (strain DSM 17950 / CFBP 7177 / CIP 109463 / NCPPB 4357 / Et1/99) TaxID=465817 RepID=B2VHF3_ERWT9|nr:restriction endonuclease subunit S [Erwinia tasmaniensis]CAO98373.1 type I restriction-modification system, specifity subunit [Erwinia tasmaniensis Et1/99]